MYRFRPRLVPSLFALAGLSILLSLGTWQLRRMWAADEARARFESRLAEPAFDGSDPPADPHERRARLSGRPDWDRHLLILGKYMWMYIGYQVIVPVRLDGGGTVLVDVGWVPKDEWDLILARERAQGAERRYEGLARVPEPGEGMARAAGAPAEGFVREWRRVDPAEMGRALGEPVAPWILVDGPGLGADDPISDRDPPIAGWRMVPHAIAHGQYAFTWYSLAATLLLVWGSASFRREDAPGVGR